MKSREELHEVLVDLLGSRNVYFQPPENLKLKYPCIVYELSDIRPVRADNIIYLKNKLYTVTVIDEDPDSEIVTDMVELPYCDFDRWYATSNLNHWVFSLYF